MNFKYNKSIFKSFEIQECENSKFQSQRLPLLAGSTIEIEGTTYTIPQPTYKIRKEEYSNLKVIYTNINAPIMDKIQKLVLSNPDAHVIALSELETDVKHIQNRDVLPLNWVPYYHSPMSIIHKGKSMNMITALILVRQDLAEKVIISYKKSPFISIFIKTNNLRVNIMAFYAPVDSSRKWKAIGGVEDFLDKFLECIESIGEAKSFIGGDMNADIIVNYTKETNKRSIFVSLVNKALKSWTYLQKGWTNAKKGRNNSISRNVLDLIAVRGMKISNYTQEPGISIGNNGHIVALCEFDVPMNNIIGTQTIIQRNKVDPKDVFNLVSLTHDDFIREYKVKCIMDQKKLDIGVRDGQCHSFNLLINHIEQIFEHLMNPREKTVPKYANFSDLDEDTKTIRNVRANIFRLIDTMEEGRHKSLLTQRYEFIDKEFRAGVARDTRITAGTLISKYDYSQNNLYKVYKAIAVKDWVNAAREDPFSADELKEGLLELYHDITAHTTNLVPSFNICDKMPTPKFLFKFDDASLPDWDTIKGGLKKVSDIFNSLKPSTKGLHSSLDRDHCNMLPDSYKRMLYDSCKTALKLNSFRDEYAVTKWIAILKKGDPMDRKNRRYLSIGKMHQQFKFKIIASALLWWAEENKFLCGAQFGFRAKSGTDLAVGTALYEIASIHRDSAIAMTCLDLSSAFFCVTHSNLMNLFKKIIHEDSLPFFEKMLQPRKAKMYAKGKSTDIFTIPSCGTAQGEGTSPILFILIMSACLTYTLKRKDQNTSKLGQSASMFADDLQLLTWACTIANLLNLTDEVIIRAAEYTKNCGFRINAKKSEIIIFGNKKLCSDFPPIYESPCGDIERKYVINMLGLRFTDQLDFTPQIIHILGKMDYHCLNIRRLKDYGLKQHVLRVFFMPVFGNFNYGTGLMPKWPDKYYEKAQTKINRTIRYILDLKRDDNNHHIPQRLMLNMVGIMPFHLQHKRNAILLLNRIYKNQKPEKFLSYIKRHMYTPPGWDPQDKNKNHIAFMINNDAPRLNFYTDETRMANPTLMKKVFPNTVAPWFNDLPASLRLLLGTKKFDYEYLKYACSFCAHPVKKSHYKCSFCKTSLKIDDINLDEVIGEIQLRYRKDYTPSEDEELRNLDKVNLFNSICTLNMIHEKIIEIEGNRWDSDSTILDEEYIEDQEEDDTYEI